jgi:hypothetical protein
VTVKLMQVEIRSDTDQRLKEGAAQTSWCSEWAVHVSKPPVGANHAH